MLDLNLRNARRQRDPNPYLAGPIGVYRKMRLMESLKIHIEDHATMITVV